MTDTEKLIRGSTAVTVAIVTGIAAYVSYTHIYAVSHNPLLAFSIDGMIITSTLVLMAANRAKIERMWLAYVGVWLGIIATLAANIAYGYPDGLLSAVWSTWPAICFVVSVETIAQLSRRKRKRNVRKPALAPIDLNTGASLVTANKAPRVMTKSPGPPPGHEPVYAKATTDRMDAHGVTTPKDLPNKGKVPGIKAIRNELKCGQPVAYEVQAIMVKGLTDDIHEAKKIRDEEKANGNTSNQNTV
jgi:hypothetical protein